MSLSQCSGSPDGRYCFREATHLQAEGDRHVLVCERHARAWPKPIRVAPPTVPDEERFEVLVEPDLLTIRSGPESATWSPPDHHGAMAWLMRRGCLPRSAESLLRGVE